MEIRRVVVVGIGVMGEAIVSMLIKSRIPDLEISVLERSKERLKEIEAKYGLSSKGVVESEVIFLAVKPQDLDSTLEIIKGDIRPQTLVVSVLAGINSAQIQRHLGRSIRVVRVMPNTPLLLGEGMSVITKGTSGTDADIAWVDGVFSNSGKTLVVDEELMDAVTAVSGSGPAYFYGFVEAITKAAMTLGLPEQDSKLLVQQTLIGAAKMVQESGKDAATLRGEVTSPNGTTAAALSSFESSGWEEIVYRAMKAARDRSRELSN